MLRIILEFKFASSNWVLTTQRCWLLPLVVLHTILELERSIFIRIRPDIIIIILRIVFFENIWSLSPYGFDGAKIAAFDLRLASVGRGLLLIESLISRAVHFAVPLCLLGLLVIFLFVFFPLVFTQYFFLTRHDEATFLQKRYSVILHDHFVEALVNLKLMLSKDFLQLEILLLLWSLHFQNIIKLFPIVNFFAHILQFLDSFL